MMEAGESVQAQRIVALLADGLLYGNGGGQTELSIHFDPEAFAKSR